MVSMKMKLKKPTFKILGKKHKKEESTITVEPTIERTPVENDPIMEDREDADNVAQMEEERHPTNDERSPPADDGSVLTEVNDDLSTVKEEPSKEEAEEDAAQESAPHAREQDTPSFVEKDTSPSMDESLTLDAAITGPGDLSPVHTPAFCGCFGN
mmetsp:Transcript_29352/g.62366  ORF Transcript_29352/g.62366 Transcript_29352/m.62366 type:complete len:156 (+) Transcript_29352:115-582(+)|eukprot:CAMPEP_0172304878 /NCGR_PEP_ID=MMETSP1058-20130122/6244_1 /TAXON_ID=83371 /ORGANISM="Detonula confervacea, Strain CCMP 353" /LENGTH=155 /DNA_ID=CAMNT_0013016277 /DNA_START=67 /DNA_END=534 /DNA_ORIENTATION=-